MVKQEQRTNRKSEGGHGEHMRTREEEKHGIKARYLSHMRTRTEQSDQQRVREQHKLN